MRSRAPDDVLHDRSPQTLSALVLAHEQMTQPTNPMISNIGVDIQTADRREFAICTYAEKRFPVFVEAIGTVIPFAHHPLHERAAVPARVLPQTTEIAVFQIDLQDVPRHVQAVALTCRKTFAGPPLQAVAVVQNVHIRPAG